MPKVSDKITRAEIKKLEDRLEQIKKSCREYDFKQPRRERVKTRGREHRKLSKIRRERSSSSSSSTSSDPTARSLSPERPSKYRRIISSDEDSTSSSNNVDEEVISLLGPNVAQPVNKGPKIQQDLAERWMSILKQGISQEERNCLISEYPIPANCPQLNPPKLNEVVASAFSDSATRRDLRLALLQTQVGAAVSALGLVLTDLLKQNVGGVNNVAIKRLSDSGRLLVDLFHCESNSRRELATMVLNKDLKDTLEKTTVTGWLFGDDLEEKIKASKNMQKSGQDLKPVKSSSTKVFRNLNFKRLPRTSFGTRQGRLQVHQSQNPRNRPWQQHQDQHQRQQSDRRGQPSKFRRRNPLT